MSDYENDYGDSYEDEVGIPMTGIPVDYTPPEPNGIFMVKCISVTTKSKRGASLLCQVIETIEAKPDGDVEPGFTFTIYLPIDCEYYMETKPKWDVRTLNYNIYLSFGVERSDDNNFYPRQFKDKVAKLRIATKPDAEGVPQTNVNVWYPAQTA